MHTITSSLVSLQPKGFVSDLKPLGRVLSPVSGDRRSNPPASDGGTIEIESEPDEPTTRSILRGIAALKGVNEMNLRPLHREIDPDALETLVEHARERDRDVRLEFSFEGCTVIVREDGRIRLTSSR